MAGTRLLVVASFFVSFLACTALAVWIGLRDDILMVRLLGRSRSRHLTKRHVPPFDSAAITIVTADSQVNYWTTVVRKLARATRDNLQIVGSDRLPPLLDRNSEHTQSRRGTPYGVGCADPSEITVGDLWICESMDHGAELVFAGSTMLLYPKSLSSRQADLASVYPTSLPGAPTQQVVEVVLLFAPNVGGWKQIADGAQNWLRERDFGPCLTDIQLDVQFSHFPLTSDNELSSDDVTSSFFTGKKDRWRAILYITPAAVSAVDSNGKKSNMAESQWEFLRISHPGEVTEIALESLTDAMMQRCLGVALEQSTVPVQSTGNVELLFYEKLFYQRMLRQAYEDTADVANTMFQTLQTLPSNVHFPKSVADQYNKAVHLLHWALSESRSGNFEQATDTLASSKRILVDIQTSTALSAPMDLPLEQYAAVFAPLLFPLFLPILATLIREYKRYVKLKRKKQSDEQLKTE